MIQSIARGICAARYYILRIRPSWVATPSPNPPGRPALRSLSEATNYDQPQVRILLGVLFCGGGLQLLLRPEAREGSRPTSLSCRSVPIISSAPLPALPRLRIRPSLLRIPPVPRYQVPALIYPELASVAFWRPRP